jgi:hypothetical protein
MSSENESDKRQQSPQKWEEESEVEKGEDPANRKIQLLFCVALFEHLLIHADQKVGSKRVLVLS